MIKRPRLTVAQRSALLHAAQGRLDQLKVEIDASELGWRKKLLESEHKYLSDAVGWLWSRPAIDDGK